MVDAVMILAKAIRAAIQENRSFATKSIDCHNDDDKWLDGQLLRKKINQVKLNNHPPVVLFRCKVLYSLLITYQGKFYFQIFRKHRFWNFKLGNHV